MISNARPYNGPERRIFHRRNNSDRRIDVRFEPSKGDRRTSPGRRKSDEDGNHWRFNP